MTLFEDGTRFRFILPASWTPRAHSAEPDRGIGPR